MLTLIAISTLPFVQAVVLAPILPVITQSYSEDPHSTLLVRLLLVAPSACVVVSAAGAGYLIDRAEKKMWLVLGLVLYAICGVAAFASDSLEWMVAFRFILGISLAILMTSSTALIADYFTGAERERALGWQNAARGFSNTATPLLGALIAAFNWRFAFLVTLIGLVLVWPASRLPKPPGRRTAAEHAFSYREVSGIYLLGFAGFLILYLLTLQIAFHLIELGSKSAILPAVSLGVAALTAAGCSTQYEPFRRRLSFEMIAMLAFFLMSTGYLLIGGFRSFSLLMAGLVLSGLGFGLNVPNCSAWILSKVPTNARGRALGGLTSAIFLGHLAAPFAYDPLVRAFGSGNTFLGVAAASLLIALSVKALSPRALAIPG